MSLALDHLVIRVDALERAVADYTALGFSVQPGGRHADGASHNALIPFADGSYLELIAFLRPEPRRRWWQLEGGVVDLALLPDDTGAAIAQAAARGLVYDGPHAGGRLRPDGVELRWWFGWPPSHDLPFLCGDATPRALRVPGGAACHHPNGVGGIAAVTLAVADPQRSLQRWRALAGPQLATPAAGPADDPGLERRHCALGTTTFVLAAPAAAGPPPTPAAGALREHLARRGEGVCAVALQGADAALQRALARALGHAAALAGGAD